MQECSTRNRWALIGLVAVLGFTCSKALATPVMGGLFSDHMVLQRDKPIQIFGTAIAGEKITATLAGESSSTRTAPNGHWSLFLKSMKAGGPFNLVISGKTSIEFHDVLIGEVWFASGQSNMDYILARSQGANVELPRANLPLLRLLKIPRNSVLDPEQDVQAQWTLCTPSTAHDFSAVAYYFARDLSRRLNVPVGMIQSTWSGSTGEEWTSYKTLEQTPELRTIVEHWQAGPYTTKHFASDGEDFNLQFSSFELLPVSGSASSVGFSILDHRLPETFDGGFWSATPPGVFSITYSGFGHSPYALDFSGKLTLEDAPSLRANLSGSESSGLPAYDLSAYTGMRFQVRGKGCFHTEFEQPITTDGDNYSSSRICASEQWTPVTVLFKDCKQAGWGVVHPLLLQQISAFAIDAEPTAQHADERPPAGLYNGMVAPVSRYTIRGALWYQGEGNSSRAAQYRTLLLALIHDWRIAWKDADLAFLIVQLPNLGSPTLNAEDSGWAEIREDQALAATQIPNVGLAVTIDLGEAHNLHPPRKAEVGERLALLALGKVFGLPQEFSGPAFERSEFRSNNIQLTFSHATGLSGRGEEPVQGFAIAGQDRKFFPANASISGNIVTVASPSVPHPVALRYAWAANPISNLVNAADLPAAPFRTDTWPLQKSPSK